MTVQELIDALKGYDADAEVTVASETVAGVTECHIALVSGEIIADWDHDDDEPDPLF